MKKVLCFILLSFLLLCTACGKKSDPTGISVDEFDKIKMEMDLEEVQDIVGGDGEKISESKEEKEEYYEHRAVYRFAGENNGYADIEFVLKAYKDVLKMNFDGYLVTSKNQKDLS